MDKLPPKVSVILTSLNHGKYVGEAIESVLAQTFADFELIIWDDASDDDSWEVIQRYSDPRIKTFRNTKRGRAIVGINRCISEIAQGQLLAIHHSDDVWHSEKLARQVAFLEANPEVGAVFTNANIILENGDPLQDENHFYYNVFAQPNRSRHEWLRQLYLQGNVLCHPSVLIRKECYRTCGAYRHGFGQLGDFDMWVRLCLHYPIHVLPQKLVDFRILNTQRNNSGNRFDSRVRSDVELVHVLRHFLALENFDELVQVLPDTRMYKAGEHSSIPFALAMVTLEISSNPVYQLFAFDILFKLIFDPQSAPEIKQVYDFDYQSLIVLTGRYDIFRDEALTQLKAEMTEQVRLHEESRKEQELLLNTARSDIARSSLKVTDRDQQISERDQHIEELKTALANLIEQNQEASHASYLEIDRLSYNLAAMRNSTSWRMTAPLRFLIFNAKRIVRLLRRLPGMIQQAGGVKESSAKAIQVLRQEGLTGLKMRIRRQGALVQQKEVLQAALIAQSKVMEVQPYYLDPNENVAVAAPSNRRIGVHLTVSGPGDVQGFIARTSQWQLPLSVYVTILGNGHNDAVEQLLRQALPKLEKLVIQVSTGVAGFPASTGQYYSELLEHEWLGLFDLTQPHTSSTLDIMLGAPGGSAQHIYKLLGELAQDSSVIYPEFHSSQPQEPTGWGNEHQRRELELLLEQLGATQLQEFSSIDFPRQGMLWGRTPALQQFLELSRTNADVVHLDTLKRLPLLLAGLAGGSIKCLHQGDSISDFRHYEESHDFSGSIVHDDVKVLSYYLPQFHPTPENDLWHGKGFTEWTKVRAANPLFKGHFQQHIPHPDSGYYLLDSPETLRKQAEQMRAAGVYGQVFYHYWFTGKLILEEPVRMLLDTPDIQMPFCFCWANENWTRRWDGNESEILLGQNYSADDAKAFIQYLIPFFKDPRYIRVNDRPVLSIYRPSSIPDTKEYLDIWESECAAHGIARPYVVAVLTRGTVDPRDHGMDAGTERVLHDWTDGAVAERKHELQQYTHMAGSVLEYANVADFYMAQTDAKEFPYYRSLVPTWDNTARYGDRALLLHGSTPEKFQQWLESSIQYSKKHLPSNERFILVNAWNEWAEGAHLEPDTRFGYSYLNSVGRALSGLSYGRQLTPVEQQSRPTKLAMQISTEAQELLHQDSDLHRRFLLCLGAAVSELKNCSVGAVDKALAAHLALPCVTADESDFVLSITRPALFDHELLLKLLDMAQSAPGSVVIPNDYRAGTSLVQCTENGSVTEAEAYQSSMRLAPSHLPEGRLKNIRLRTEAYCFPSHPWSKSADSAPQVTTIMRFHKSGSLAPLKNALYSLAAMHNCTVTPLITAQDLSVQQKADLTVLLQTIPLPHGAVPRVEYYETLNGKGDLRSKMLNHALSLVSTQYAAFLDYDDLMMPHAYDWMVSRLEKTGKAATFGRIYATLYNGHTGEILERKANFEYGYSYDDFVSNNHTPLHGFLLDIQKMDVTSLIYHDDHRYMEDYFLTLQLFTRENTDWESLRDNVYVGDYIHSIEREHTLAITDNAERQRLLADPEYQACDRRINDLRKKLSSGERLSN
ncbi:glycoside hydrolase family 99-like domain-containing protein [Pseudomonas sp. CAN2814]|uniref:glycoside hydrolase family 99-like domain-containing protein n=1 Tax=Pseudomonas sp. CAN1 TaxID=3046726 RepID=UPI00264897CD|nr:glycoside hydrolase family 99-like domain-containing protein [Pseudomonas sp. CAN1]MDN6856453.1 glycoside hydrolase family 99-like domain-containing protein [Pseudomonas sp. CAN1]